jgi:guanylate cyclase, other
MICVTVLKVVVLLATISTIEVKKYYILFFLKLSHDAISYLNINLDLFWKSPELLRNPNVHGTQKGDVYAFAIILYEICGRKGPFGSTEYEPKTIIELVRKIPTDNENTFRPDLDQCLLDMYSGDKERRNSIKACIQDCWHETPEKRPDFPTIRTRLKKMRDGKSKNIMDQMMEMMEKYTNNLEDIVNDRTRLLYEEKRKTEDLLNRMLPQLVAEKLTMGLGVEPVSYDAVNYFSMPCNHHSLLFC